MLSICESGVQPSLDENLAFLGVDGDTNHPRRHQRLLTRMGKQGNERH